MFSYKKKDSFHEVAENIDSWETIGIELLHRKYKFEFSDSEKKLLRNMLKFNPPPLHTRRKVKNLTIIFNIIIYSYGSLHQVLLVKWKIIQDIIINYYNIVN